MNTSQSKGELNVTDVIIRWKIRNAWNLRKHGVMSSPFMIKDQRMNFYIRKYEKNLAFYLYFEHPSISVLQFLFTVNFISKCDEELFIAEKKINTSEANELVLLETLVVTDASKKICKVLQHEDIWVISCLISSINESDLGDVTKCTPVENTEVLCFESLSSDFEKFRTDQRSCDVVLRAEDITFPVHKSILSARSPKFASILKHQALESDKEIIDILDISAFALRKTLIYIYSGKIYDLNSETAIELFAAADNYFLFEMKDICLKFLQSNITIVNALEVSVLAHKQNNQTIKDEAEIFLSKHINTILRTEKWKEFCENNPIVANEILTNLLLKTRKDS